MMEMESLTVNADKPLVVSSLSNCPRELLYNILFHCHQTHDVVREKLNSNEGESYLYIDRASGSRNLGRVCRLWRNAIEAGMVPAQKFREIQLSDQQFFRLVAEEGLGKYLMAPGQVSRLGLPEILRYRTVTIICQQTDNSYSPDAITPLHPLVTPKKLNIVITDGRTVDIREIFQHFKTPYTNLLESFQHEFLASRRGADPDNNINIIVWDGQISLKSSRESFKIPIAMGRVDLSINKWTDDTTIGDIPWIFGQLCRYSRPMVMGFHLLQAQESSFTDKWCRQRPSCTLDNTFLREIHLTGISSDGFLRLLQCASIEVWCVEMLRIRFLPIHDRELCYWDYRIFDKTTWPSRIEASECDPWSEYPDFMTFPKVSLRRRLDGRVQEVVKQQMQALCQIASPEEMEIILGWGVGPAENKDIAADIDVERYMGRSLQWTSLKSVVVEGETSDEETNKFLELHILQAEVPFLEVLETTGRFVGPIRRSGSPEERLSLYVWATAL
ncbi:hypothetical protein DFP73DRAFT_616763 [Morchella snyderi]|nr:hypothetical protein DFP73DRAFT_616763 [Morchella snyderi]